jgi:hypothetical protein
MWRLAITAIAAAIFVQPVTAQTPAQEAQQRICETYVNINRERAIECYERMIDEAERDRERAAVRGERYDVALSFLARHGINGPDTDAKHEVARRRGILFAVILDQCWARTDNADRLEHCLDQREKAEIMLGNALDKSLD